MVALTEALAKEFGPAKVYRPYRDVRFAKDKTPYKDHQGAFVPAGPATGWYVEVGAPGVRVGAGFYHAEADRLAAFRAAVANDRTGPELERLIATVLWRSRSIRGWSAAKPRGVVFSRSPARVHPRRSRPRRIRSSSGPVRSWATAARNAASRSASAW
jgi:hypothetical protein